VETFPTKSLVKDQHKEKKNENDKKNAHQLARLVSFFSCFGTQVSVSWCGQVITELLFTVI